MPMWSEGIYDGISVYLLDGTGKVAVHYFTNVELRKPPLKNPLLYGLNLYLCPKPNEGNLPIPG